MLKYVLLFFAFWWKLWGVPLVWQVDRRTIWEEDWLMELMRGVELEVVDDGRYEKLIDRSIIVISKADAQAQAAYFERLKELGYKFGIIHLSDETYSDSTGFYKDASFVFRNYWDPRFAQMKNVHCFALGYKSGFRHEKAEQKLPAAGRKYTWSFAGQINNKPTRRMMLGAMYVIPNYYIHETFSFGDAKALTSVDYENLLLDSVFIPAPMGWTNPDSFRVWEALESGCIPIVEKGGFDYFAQFLGSHPMITLDSWYVAEWVLEPYLSDTQLLEQKRQACYAWWQAYKQQLHELFVQTISDTLVR